MGDLISRQAAIDAVRNINAIVRPISESDDMLLIDQAEAMTELMMLPSARPVRLTDDDFETIRIHLNAFKEKLCNQRRWKEADEYQRIIDRFMAFASVQPDNCSEIPNSSDFVSRKAVREMVATWSYDMAEWEDMELALHDVDELPPAQPEVIHCKDCDLWHRTGCPMNVFVKKPEPGYFCGTGRRKENE